MRSEGNRLLEAIDELIKIAREARLPAEIYHLKAAGAENWCPAGSGADPAAQAGPPRGVEVDPRALAAALGIAATLIACSMLSRSAYTTVSEGAARDRRRAAAGCSDASTRPLAAAASRSSAGSSATPLASVSCAAWISRSAESFLGAEQLARDLG